MYNTLLKNIAAVSGVAGTCIYNKQDGILYRETAEKLTDNLLEDTALHLLRLFQMGAMSGIKAGPVHFHFDRYAVVSLPLQNDSIFLALCDPEIDACQISAKAASLTHMAYDELREHNEPDNDTDIGDIQEIADIQEFEQVEDTDYHSTELEAMLIKIEQALAGAIGPVAGMVMEDYIEQWRKSGPAVTARIVELTTLLVEEIGEPEAAQDFIAKVENID